MNIVLLHAHAVGRNLSVYGRPVDTPHLLRFARQATVFRNAFAVSPVASPSQAALLCGQLPHLVDVLGPVDRGFRLAHTKSHLAHTLNKAGFLTVQTGGQSLFAPDQTLPYARVLPVSAQSALDTDVSAACAACAFLDEVAQGGVKQPFFLSCGFALAHRPFLLPPEEADGRFCAPADGLPDTRRTRADFSGYRHTLSFLDGCVGQVLEALRNTGRMEDTIVIFTTDHGGPFPFAEGQLTDNGLGVALMVHVPQNPSAGSVCNALVSHLDVYPTLCDWLGIPLPQWLIGKSLRPVFEKRRDEVREELLAQTTYAAAYEPLRCIRTARYKLVKSYDPDCRPVAPNIPDSPSKDVLFEVGWALHERPLLALYDLLLDPSEQHNLIDALDLWSTRTDLLARMEGQLREMGDPLMRGFVPPPAGARLNRRSQRSADEETYVVEA